MQKIKLDWGQDYQILAHNKPQNLGSLLIKFSLSAICISYDKIIYF